MKKSFVLGLAILFVAGLFMTACRLITTSEFAPSLTATTDKTEAKIGDTVTVTVTFRDLSSQTMNRHFDVELPSWIVAEGGENKEDILRVVFTPEEDFNWWDYAASKGNETGRRQTIRIRGGETIKKKFTHTITEAEDLYVNTAAFFIMGGWGRNNGLITFSAPIKIKVQQGE